MWNTKKLAGSKGRRIGPMKRTAKHGVRSPNACTKKHSQDGKAAVLMRSSNPKTVRSEIKTSPVQEECGSNTESGALVCCCTCSNSTTQTRPKQCKHKGAKQATRHTKGAETSDKTNFADVLTGSRKAIVQSTSRVKHRPRADEGTTRAARRDESRSRGQGRREV